MRGSRRTTLCLAVLSVWGHSKWAAACTSYGSVSGVVNQDVPSCTNVYAPTSEAAVVTIDGTGGAPITASGDDTYYDTFSTTNHIAQISSFVRVEPASTATADAKITFRGNQALSVSPSDPYHMDGIVVRASSSSPVDAAVVLDGANFSANVGSQGANGVSIATDGGAHSATMTLTNSVLDVDTGGAYGISLIGAGAALTSTGTQNTLRIGGAFAPTTSAIYANSGAKLDFTGRLNFNSSQAGVDIVGGSTLHLDGTDRSQSTIHVAGVSGIYTLGINYQSADTTGALKNLTVDLTANEGAGGRGAEGFNVNMSGGALAVENVGLTSNMIDSSALTVSGGSLTASGLSVDVGGKGTGGVDVEPNTNGQLTLNDAVGVNTIVTRGAADLAPTFSDLPYANAAGVRLLGGTISLSGTHIDTYGVGAPGIYLRQGSITTGADVAVHTHSDGASAVVYTPRAGNVADVTAAFASTTSLTTDGAEAYGFVADGYDRYDGSNTPHSFSLSFGSLGLSPSAFLVQGAGSSAIGARNDATLVLDGQDLSALAGLPSGTYAAGAEAGGTIRFAQGARSGGASLLAGAGGTLDFNDDSASAAGSVVTISQGSGASTRGELDASGRTQALDVGGLASTGSGGTNGLVNLGGNDLLIDGASGTSNTFSGAIEGGGSLIKSGAGVQTFAGQNAFDYTGATQIDGGTLAVAGGVSGKDANGPKRFQLNAGGTLNVGNNQGSFELGAISGDGTVQLTDSGTNASSDLVLDGVGAAQTFSGTITGSGGVVLRSGPGATQTFSGSHVFDFTGDVTLGSGTLAVTGQATASGNRFMFDDGANSGGTLDIGANGPAGFSVAGIEAQNPGTTARINLGASSSPANLVLSGSGNYNFGGTISGYGNIVKQGSGTQTMSGTDPFAFTGTTIVADGVLQLRNIADPSQFDHTFELDGGWLDLSDSTFDSSGVNANDWAKLHVTDGSNAASSHIIGGDDKVAVGGDGAASVEAAQIDGGVFVVKTGSNTTTLTGANHYVGNTRVLGGTLKVSDDDNLGDTRYEREVVLDGGDLEIDSGGAFNSSRQLQLQSAGAVRVDGAASTVATLGSIAGSGQTLTKTGGGALTFTGGGVLGQAIVSDGLLGLRAVRVDATTLSASNQAAIDQAAGTTVDLDGATVVSQGDAIVANGTSTLNLTGDTKVTAGGATYRVESGTGTLNASAQSLIGNVLAADGAGTALAIRLAANSVFTGTPALTNGAVATLSLDASSSWNMTADTALAGLSNLGAITFGARLPNAAAAAVAKAAQDSGYQTLMVNGDYRGGGVINMRTELNVGGSLADQHTDRVIVTGNVTGETQLSLTTSGAGANTNTALNNRAIPTEGISLAQVGGTSTAGAFTLKGGYVAAAGSPYQYRIFAYGPGSYGPPAASQSVLPNGEVPQWDYRLQTSYTDSNGNVQPGIPPDGHPTLLPQGSSYLTAPLALQNYESIVADNLYRRLGDVRRGAFDAKEKADDVFARTIDSRSVYHSSRSFSDYGYDFGQSITALQFGADWLQRKSADRDFRLGTAVTLGDTPVRPQAASAESSKTSITAFNVALTGTWQRRDGWYADGLLSAGWYRGTVATSARGEVGRIHANGFDGSLEVGRGFTLPVVSGGLDVEPHVRVLAQVLHFEDRKDNDGLDVGTGDLFALTGLVGVRVSMSMPGTASFRPYARVDFSNTWMNSPSVTMSGQSFELAKQGSAMQVGVGATGLLTPNLAIYGELSGQQRLGTGMSTVAATLGLRYTF